MSVIHSIKNKKLVAVEASTSNWSTVFPSEIKTEQKSLLFVKKLLAVGISTLTYLRNIFPEKAYADKCCEGLNLKMLVNSSDCPGVPHFVEWIMGAFDAIQHKYLRQLTLAFSGSDNPDAAVLETYSFSFSYGSDGSASIDDVASSAIHKPQGACSSTGSSKPRRHDVRKSTLKMLRSIIVLMQGLDHLPSDVYLSMRLRYYDDVTPGDYEPPGFRSCDQASYVFSGVVAALGMGDVNTGHHSVTLRLKTTDKHFAEDHPHLRDENSSQESTTVAEASNTSALQNPGDVVAGNPNATSTPMLSTCSSVPSAAVATTDDLPRGLEEIQINDCGDTNRNDGCHDCECDRSTRSGDRASRGTRNRDIDSSNFVAGIESSSASDNKDSATPEKKERTTSTGEGPCANENKPLDTIENHQSVTNNDNGSVIEISSDASNGAPATQASESVVEIDGVNFQRSARCRRFNSFVWTSPPLVVPATLEGNDGEAGKSDAQEQLVPSMVRSGTKATKSAPQVDLNDNVNAVSLQHPSPLVEAGPSALSNVTIDLECSEQVIGVHSGTLTGPITSASQNTFATPTAYSPDRAREDSISAATSNLVSGVSKEDEINEKGNIECTPIDSPGSIDGDATPLLVAKLCKEELNPTPDDRSAEVGSEAHQRSRQTETPVMYKRDSTSSCRTPIQRAPGSAGSGASQCSVRSVSVALAPSCPSPGYPVRCACQVHADDGLMILCDVCGYWQHGACFCILRVEDAPERHLCQLCSDPPALCSDPRLCFLSQQTLEETCLFRRSLSVLQSSGSSANTEFSSVALAQRLGCDIARATTVVEKLLGAGVLSESEVGDRKRKRKLVVKLDVLENDAVPKFFKKQNSQSMETEEPHPSEQCSQEWAPLPKKRKSSMSATVVKKYSGTIP